MNLLANRIREWVRIGVWSLLSVLIEGCLCTELPERTADRIRSLLSSPPLHNFRSSLFTGTSCLGFVSTCNTETCYFSTCKTENWRVLTTQDRNLEDEFIQLWYKVSDKKNCYSFTASFRYIFFLKNT